MTTYYSTNNLFQYTVTNNSSTYTDDDDDYEIIAAAFNMWDNIVDKDSRFSSYTITVTVTFDTLSAGVLGGASINTVYYFGSMSFGNTFPATGSITLSDSYLPSLKTTTHDDGKTSYYHVFLHELGHILGIGSLWSLTNFPKTSYTEDSTTKYYYTGEKALAEYKNYFQDFSYNDFLGIPIEDDGSSGTVNVHPEEGSEGSVSSDDRYINGIFHPGLDTELMTGWLDSSPTNAPLSRITIAFLEDMGYNVDYSYANIYRSYSYDSFSDNISYTMSTWLDNSANANTLKSTYIQGFLDVSGGSIITRNSSDHLLIGGDSSFNNNVYFSNNGVGIGIEQPSHALDINGTLNITNGNLYVRDDVSLNNGTFSVLGDLSANQKIIGGNVSSSAITFDSSSNFQKRLFVNAGDISYNGTYTYQESVTSLPTTWDNFSFAEDNTYGDRPASCEINEDGTIFAYGDDYWGVGNKTQGSTRVYEYRTITQTEWNNGNTTNTTYSSGVKVIITGGDSSLDTNKKYWIQRDMDIPYGNSLIGYNQNYNLSVGGMSDDGQYILITAAANGNGYYVVKWNSSNSRYQLFGSSGIINPSGLTVNPDSQMRPGTVAMSRDGLTIVSGTGSSSHKTIYVYTSNGTNNYALTRTIYSSSFSSYYGLTVAISGDGSIVVAYNGSSSLQRYYVSSGSTYGSALLPTGADSYYGQIIKLNNDGSTLVTSDYGNIYIYKGTGTTLYQTISIYGMYFTISKDASILQTQSSNNSLQVFIDNGTAYTEQTSYTYSNETSYTYRTNPLDGGRTYLYSMSADGNAFAVAVSADSFQMWRREEETVYTTGTANQTHASDLASNGTFSSDISFNHSLIVPGNMVVVDASNVNTYGSYTTYSDPSGLVFFNVGKSKSHVFNIVNQDNVGVYMNTGSTSFTSTSDANLKKNIKPSTDSLNKIMKLKPCTFDWKHNDKKEIGFIAQEVEEVYPELVDENETIDGSKYKGIKMSGLIPEIVNSLRELNNECDNLANSFR
jgi:hypothetical protein